MSNQYFTNPYSAVSLVDGVTASASLWNTERGNVDSALDSVESGFDILPAPYDATGVNKGFSDAIYVGSATLDDHAMKKSQIITEINTKIATGCNVDELSLLDTKNGDILLFFFGNL